MQENRFSDYWKNKYTYFSTVVNWAGLKFSHRGFSSVDMNPEIDLDEKSEKESAKTAIHIYIYIYTGLS